MIGIYKITNCTNEKFYIGSSKNIQQRWYKHKALLRHNKHENQKFQNAWNKYGEDSFIFDIIEYCDEENLLDREQYYIDSMLFAQEFMKKENKKFYELGYNLAPDVKFSVMSEETIQKISDTLKRKYKDETISKTHTKQCYQYNRFTGELIKIWDIINDACRFYNTPNKTTSVIHRNLWGDTPSALNSVFSYEPITFYWARAPQKRSTLVVHNAIEKTYSFYDSIPTFLVAIGLNPESRVTINKCITNKTLFKQQYLCFKIDAPVIYDRKPFELLGTREDLVTKTNEEIQCVNV